MSKLRYGTGNKRKDKISKKQKEAIFRNEGWSLLSIEEKIDSLNKRRGESLKQKKKLLEIQKQKEKEQGKENIETVIKKANNPKSPTHNKKNEKINKKGKNSRGK